MHQLRVFQNIGIASCLLSGEGALQVAGSVHVVIAHSLGGTELFQPATPVVGESIEIRYRIGLEESQAQPTLYDVRGRRIQTLASGRLRRGLHVLTWDRTQSEQALTPGTYFLHLRAKRFTRSRKIVLLAP